MTAGPPWKIDAIAPKIAPKAAPATVHFAMVQFMVAFSFMIFSCLRAVGAKEFPAANGACDDNRSASKKSAKSATRIVNLERGDDRQRAAGVHAGVATMSRKRIIASR